MNKFGLLIVLSLGLALSPLCALENKSLSQADADFFASNANLNVVALSDTEMNLTQGEGWFSRFIAKWLRPSIKPTRR